MLHRPLHTVWPALDNVGEQHLLHCHKRPAMGGGLSCCVLSIFASVVIVSSTTYTNMAVIMGWSMSMPFYGRNDGRQVTGLWQWQGLWWDHQEGWGHGRMGADIITLAWVIACMVNWATLGLVSAYCSSSSSSWPSSLSSFLMSSTKRAMDLALVSPSSLQWKSVNQSSGKHSPLQLLTQAEDLNSKAWLSCFYIFSSHRITRIMSCMRHFGANICQTWWSLS